jgi:tetratricopeptide (TPR) repeat protein
MIRKSSGPWIAVVAAVWCGLPATLVFPANNSDELNDLVGRMQFNYYAADARALRQDVQEVSALEVDPELTRVRDYQVGYGQWKLAETLQVKDRSAARHAAGACIDATNKALDAVPKRANIPRPDVMHAELHAIQAGCYGTLGETARAGKLLDDARALQPANPRILLVAAIYAINRAKSASERLVAERAIQTAVVAFDAQPPLPPGAADWGHAEALAWLGEVQLQREDRVAARNSLERALVLAPDYVFARALLARATGGR